MTRRSFVELTQALEAAAIANPGAFRQRTWLLIWLVRILLVLVFPGLGIFGITIAVASFGNLNDSLWAPFAFIFSLVLLGISIGLLPYFTVAWKSPEFPVMGIPLKRSLHPGMFELLKRAAERLEEPLDLARIDCWLGSLPSAMVTVEPPHGWFRRSRKRLVIGLPLLHSLSE